MSIGAYRPGRAWLYRLDPRAKVVAITLFLAAAALARGPGSLAIVAVATLALWQGTGRRAVEAAALLRPVGPLLAFIFLVNALAAFAGPAAGEGTELEAFAAALAGAVLATARLACALVGAATLMMTTTPERLTAALRTLLRPVVRNGRRLDEYALMLATVFRFVPLLADETLRVKRAQQSRGAHFGEGGMIARVQSWVPVIVPLFASALRRADRHGLAAASRGFFSPARHSSLVQFAWAPCDGLAVAVAALAAALCALIPF